MISKSSIRLHLVLFSLYLVGLFAVRIPVASAVTITTNFGVGADAEVRDHQPTTNFGTTVNGEMATRVLNAFPANPSASDGSDRSSKIYLRFDISGLTPVDLATNPAAILRLRTRSANNIQPNDVHAPHPVDASDVYAHFDVYGLNNYSLGGWGEGTINYNNAPGLTSDGVNGTDDINSDLTHLGTFTLPNIDGQNHMAVGTPVDFSSAGLHAFISAAQLAGQNSVTLVVHLGVDGVPPANGGTTPASFQNQNYVFVPKEQNPLPNGASWDADVAAADGAEGSPWSCQATGTTVCPLGSASGDNSQGQFSPALIFTIPEPSSMILLVAGAFATSGMIRRRK